MFENHYRAGIIGLGMIGGADQISGDALGQLVANMDGTHAVAYQDHARIDLVAGASRDPGRRERFEGRTGAKTYVDWREMIEKEALDIVSVATYTPVHAEMTIACAEAGIPVIFCEKPAATRLADADRMLEACAEQNVLLVFNHQRRFSPNHRKLADTLDRLGALSTAHIQWPTGRLGNVGTHAIDALIMVTRRRVLGVSGALDESGRPDSRGPAFKDPGGWGQMRMEGDLMATVSAPDYAATPPRTEINGSEGRAVFSPSEVRIEFWRGDTEVWPPPSDGLSGMDRAATEIVAWLDGQKPFPCDPEEGVHTLEAIVGFHASHARNAAWVDLPLDDADREIEILSG